MSLESSGITFAAFGQQFDAICQQFPDRIALIDAREEGHQMSYRKLHVLVLQHQNWLQSLGLMPGMRLGVALPNSIEMLVLFYACLRAGIGFAPIACDSTDSEAARWVALIKPRMCVVGKNINSTPEILAISHVEINQDNRFKHLHSDSAASSSDLLASTHNVPDYSKTASAIYLFSSGTTGAPKAIVLDANCLFAAGLAFTNVHQLSTAQPFTIWNYLPQSYLGGLFNMALIPLGVAGTVIVDEVFSGKTFLSFWQFVDRFEINTIWLLPTLVRGLLNIAERTQRQKYSKVSERIKNCFIGTAPIQLATKQRFEEIFNLMLLENYALSETTFLTSEFPGSVINRSEGSVGQTIDYAEIRLAPISSEFESDYFEIRVKSPYLMTGYLTENEQSPTLEGHLDELGYFKTGDLGVFSNSNLVLTGRNKDIIKKGGYLVSLKEVEVLAGSLQGISEACAVIQAHKFYGESYRLCVIVTQDFQGDSETLMAQLCGQLSKAKWPDQIEIVESFPRTASGKIRKFLLELPND